ncbi:Tripartite motif-containing protein 16 [Nibea albiflora]|uniref:Tripartite motif-containing protein 16 n=1 Tax=Nibea albiflora TaxID=240163 RepID=A0ACB7FI05_NIBAL|nr:Tripartite motif-containing protein 16 [Nibea albiflora]
MAQKGAQLDRETISCSICLDLLKDPVTIPCGHSYCMNCIHNFWDGEDEKRIYSCPQCRQTFTPRPVLVKNTMFAALVEELKKTGLQAAPDDHCYAGPEDVACDVCTGRKLKALKSCLVCLASYCEKHLQPHHDVAPLKKHKLVEPSKKLQENICSRHDEVMKMFCRTDQQCICYLCSVDEHKGHDTVSAAAERTERQRELEVSRQNIQQRIQDREKDVKELQQEVEAINGSADKAVEDSEKIFTELIRLMEKRRSDVKQQVRSQQETEVSRVKDLQEKLEQEITELKRKDAELKEVSHTEDHNQFLQNYPSLSRLSESTDSSSINIRPLRYFEDVTAAVSELRDKLQDALREKSKNISLTVTEVSVSLPQPEAEPKTRADFLKYSREITLDPNTAHTLLLLSERNRKATEMRENQFYLWHPDRFNYKSQVLSRKSLTGRCYWEVDWTGGGYIAVAYKNISRDWSDGSRFGFNNKSWALRCEKNNYKFLHNSVQTPVWGPLSSRVGVYLDHSADLQFEDGCNQHVRPRSLQRHMLFRSELRLTDCFISEEVKLTRALSQRAEMADKGAQLAEGTVSCSICLDLLKDPVTIPCGHSYCMNCIKTHWDLMDNKKIYSCPQCRQTFTPRPVLVKNTMLAVLVEELTKKLQENICSRHDEVMKMFCRTHQQCMCYLCPVDEHKGHDTVSAVPERSERLQREVEVRQQNIQQRIQDREKDVKELQQEVEAINRSADKAVEDSEVIFTELISLMEKRRSDVKQQVRSQQETEVSRVKDLQEKLEQEITEMKKRDSQLTAALTHRGSHRVSRKVPLAVTTPVHVYRLIYHQYPSSEQRIQDREKDVKELQQEVEAINRSADKAVEDSEKIFIELIHLMEKRRSAVKQQVRSQQETEVSRVKDLQEKLEQEITELKRKDAELEQLSHTEDHTEFLQNVPSLSRLSQSTDSSSINIRPLRDFEDVTAAVSELRDKLQDVLREKRKNILRRVSKVNVSLSNSQPEPKTRVGFLKYSRELTLDPNTTNSCLLLSEGNKKATVMTEQQSYSSHPDRFTSCCQVLSTESLTGRCYWEVEWSGGGVCVAVAYKNRFQFGFNDKSWALYCNKNYYNFCHNRVQTPVSGPRSSRVGVYLDHSAGILSFYSVSKTMTLLHRVQTKFTQPLYAGLWIYYVYDTAELCKLK